MKSLLFFALSIICVSLFLSTSCKSKQPVLFEIKELLITSDGPFTVGNNQIAVETSVNFDEFLSKKNINPKKVKELKLHSISIESMDTTGTIGVSQLSLSLSKDAKKIKEWANISIKNEKLLQEKMNIPETGNVKSVIDAGNLEFIADITLSKPRDIALALKANLFIEVVMEE